MKFNPIKDLTPFDRNKAVKQLGGVTDEEISSLSRGLRDTSLKTSAIVDQLRRDVSLLKRDLDKISELDRRLKRVIPIIPGQGAVAGNIFPEDKPGPEGGLNIPIPKFPKIPPFAAPAPAPVNVPDPGPVTVPEKEREKPPITIPTIPFPIPFPIPNLDDLLPQVIASNTSFINKINDIAFKVGDDLVALSKLQPKGGKYQPMSPMEQLEIITMASPGGFGFKAGGMFLMNPAILRLLPKGTQRFAQSLFGGASTVAPTVQPAIPLTSRMPRPGQLRPDQVAPRVARIPTPPATSSNLYEQLLKSTRFGISSMGEVGAPLGGTRALRKAPLMKRFDAGGIFRRGPLKTADDRAMIEALREIGLDKEIAQISDPSNIYSQRAREEVLRQLGLVDETFKRITGGGTRITKKGSSIIKPTETLTPPERFLMQGSEIDTVLGSLQTPLARVQPGSIADFIGLSHPEVRLDFLKYIAGIKNTKSGVKNYKMIEKLLRQTGMYMKMSKDGVIPMDDDVLGFVLNFYKKKGIDPRPFLENMKNNGLLEGGIEGLKTNKAKSVRDAYQFLKEMEQNKTVLPLPENYKVPPGGPQSSVMGRPRSMDLASLGIDTSVEVQEIYYIVG